MNQILDTNKIYVTKSLMRKKKVYKVIFFISVFLMCFLFSYYIYGEYDRGSKEQTSQAILEAAKNQIQDSTVIKEEDNTIYRGDVVLVILRR